MLEARPPQSKQELQRFLGQVNYLRRFISKLTGKTKEFFDLLKLRQIADFKWEEKHQNAFDKIMQYLSQPPVLVPPREEILLKLYISAANESIGYLLAQNDSVGHEQAIYYLSKILSPTEVKYTYVEKLCLALYFACTKLRHYLLKHRVYVISQTDMMKYMLNRPVLFGKIGKWLLGLIEFTLVYFLQKSVKG